MNALKLSDAHSIDTPMDNKIDIRHSTRIRVIGAESTVTDHFCDSMRLTQPLTQKTRIIRIIKAGILMVLLLTFGPANAVFQPVENGSIEDTAETVIFINKKTEGNEELFTQTPGYSYISVSSLPSTSRISLAINSAENTEYTESLSVDRIDEQYELIESYPAPDSFSDGSALLDTQESILIDTSGEIHKNNSKPVRSGDEASTISPTIGEQPLPESIIPVQPASTPNKEQASDNTFEYMDNVKDTNEDNVGDANLDAAWDVTWDTIRDILIVPGVVPQNLLWNDNDIHIQSVNEDASEAIDTPDGAKVAQSPKMSAGSYIWPANGNLTSTFGYRKATVGSKNHKGIDICANKGDPIYAADGGEVIVSERNSSFGYYVEILHDNGHITLYAHCSSLLVSVGDMVAQGQQIALMGRTGTATAIHLHFELIIDGVNVDPELYLQ